MASYFSRLDGEILRSAGFLGIDPQLLGSLLGLAGQASPRSPIEAAPQAPDIRNSEVGQALISLCHDLADLLGHDHDACLRWLEAYNLDLGASPKEILTSPEGLVRLASYVQGFRRRC